MTKLQMLKGLPASGKTTQARKLLGQGWVRVSKGDIQSMLYQDIHTNDTEKQVSTIYNDIIDTSLERGRNVVVDDTNLDPSIETSLRAMAAQHQAVFEVDERFLKVSVEQCIERDLRRCNSVGEQAIRQLYYKYIKPPVYNPDPNLTPIVLCDMDGTLSHMSGRIAYAWDRVGEDELDSTIAQILEWIQVDVILFSGRDEVCRPETEQWLDDNGIQYRELHMRPQGDLRKDFIVKRELFEQHIRDKYRVLFVLDDRDSVVQMWREMGLKVLQVEGGDF